MPRGDKSSYTQRQKRKARHIEEGYEDRGVSSKRAASIAWATVNKQEGGGRKSTSKKSSSKRSTSKKKSGGRSRSGGG